MKNSIDYKFMADIGEFGWSRIRFESGYAQTVLKTASKNRLWIDESEASVKELKNCDLGPEPPKTHVWKYSSRPSKGGIEAQAQRVGAHLYPRFDTQPARATSQVKMDSGYSDGEVTVEHRIRERLIPPLFYQCGHKCHRDRLSEDYTGIGALDLEHSLQKVSKTRCCRCVAVARWFGVQSIEFPRDRQTGEQLADLATGNVRLAGDVIDHQGYEYKSGNIHHMTFRNGVMGPDAEFHRSYGSSTQNYDEWLPVEPDKESMCQAQTLKWDPKHFGWWTGLFRPFFQRNKPYSYNGRKEVMRLADSRGVISGRKNIADFLCLPCLSACKAVPSWAFWLARGYSQENALKFHQAEVKALCPDKTIKNTDTYKWKRTDEIPEEIFRWHNGDSGHLIGDKLYAKQDWA